MQGRQNQSPEQPALSLPKGERRGNAREAEEA